jgi:hypothetical protein
VNRRTKTILAAGTVGIVLLLAASASAAEAPPPKRDPKPKPGEDDPIEDPTTDDPTTPTTTTPVWPTEDPTTDDPIEDPTDPEDPDGPRIPPFVEILHDYPDGDGFYQVREGDRFGGTNATYSIAYRYLMSEAYLAAKEAGEDDAAALEWARAVAKRNKSRATAIDVISCNGWNDVVYASFQYGTQVRAVSTGRAISLNPIHAPNRELLEQGEPPRRNASYGGVADQGEGPPYPVDPALRRFPLLWLPRLDRAALWSSNGDTVRSDDRSWRGRPRAPKSLPPPWVMRLGVDDPDDILPAVAFGCADSPSVVDLS